MLIYWLALLLTCFIAYFVIYTKKDENGNFKITFIRVFISFLPLFLVAIFRWNVGVDVVYGSGYYYIAYNTVSLFGNNIFNYENGFYLLMKICSALNLNLYLFYSVVTFIFFYFFIKFVSENSKNVIFSAIIFVLSDLYLFSFSTLRQSLGIAFALYPVSKLLKEDRFYKNWRWWLYSIIAFSMHRSIIYLYIIVFLARIKITKKALLCLTTVACVLSPLIEKILSLLISYLPYFEKYFESNMNVNSFSITYFGISLVIFVIAMINYKKLIEDDASSYKLVNFCAFVTILMINSDLLIMPYRVFPMFVPIYIILCSKIVSNIKKNTYKYIFTSLCIIIPFVLLFVNQYYIRPGAEFFSYKSIFEHLDQVWSR